MGHIINPVSLRLKYYGMWKISWSQYLRKDFSYFFFIDEYIKSLTKSISLLKCFLNKCFFFEIRYFIKNNIILFYFSFKFLRRKLFKFYWLGRYPEELLKIKRRNALYPRKIRRYKKFKRIFKKNQFNSCSSFKRYLFKLNTFFDIDRIKRRCFPYDSKLRKKAISLKIKNFNFNLSRRKLFMEYYVNNFLLDKLKLKFLIFKEIAFFRNFESYGKHLLFTFKTSAKFSKKSEPLLFFENLKKVLFDDYFVPIRKNKLSLLKKNYMIKSK